MNDPDDRTAPGSDADNPAYIFTKHGVGYSMPVPDGA